MPRSYGFALNFTLSDCGGRFSVSDYCYPMLMGGTPLIKARSIEGSGVNYAGLLADNLQASYFPELISGTSLGLLFPLLIHLTDIASGPIFPWTPRVTPVSKKAAPEPPRPFAPSPYSNVSPGRISRQHDDSPWRQRPLDRFPCPRPVGGTLASTPDPAYQWSDAGAPAPAGSLVTR